MLAGVDAADSYEELVHFLLTVHCAGVRHFVVHARKALLKGVSTKGNRYQCKVLSQKGQLLHLVSAVAIDAIRRHA